MHCAFEKLPCCSVVSVSCSATSKNKQTTETVRHLFEKKAREFYRIIRLHDQEVRSNGLFAYTGSSFYSTKVAVKSSTTIVEINELNVIFTKSKLFLLKANYYVDYYFIMRKNLCITEMIERFVGTTRNGSCLFSLCTPFYTACTVGNHDPFWQHTP